MDLYVFRHAIAADRALYARDRDRPLTSEGESKLAKVVAAFDRLGVGADVVVTSPYVRARRTAEVAAKALSAPLIVDDRLSAGATSTKFVAALAQHAADAERVMVVGHEPDLGELVSTLVFGDDISDIRMKKAGLAKLTVDGLRDGRCAQLEWLLWPKHMIGLAR